MLSPSLRQSAELFRKVLDHYRALGRPVPAQAETSLRLELEGGSRIISLPVRTSPFSPSPYNHSVQFSPRIVTAWVAVVAQDNFPVVFEEAEEDEPGED